MRSSAIAVKQGMACGYDAGGNWLQQCPTLRPESGCLEQNLWTVRVDDGCDGVDGSSPRSNRDGGIRPRPMYGHV